MMRDVTNIVALNKQGVKTKVHGEKWEGENGVSQQLGDN